MVNHNNDKISIIAEIKKASPSKGIILEDFQPLKIALEYTKTFGGRIISFCQDQFLSEVGVINESIVSTELGLKGIPDISESVNLYRDIQILGYSGGKLHVPYVSTHKGVELIRDAKNRNFKMKKKEYE